MKRHGSAAQAASAFKRALPRSVGIGAVSSSTKAPPHPRKQPSWTDSPPGARTATDPGAEGR